MPKQPQIKIIVVPVSGDPSFVKKIPNTLEAMQSIVGGLIEPVMIAPGLVLFVDEEGILKGKPLNQRLTRLANVPLCGDGFLCREDAEGECLDVTDGDIRDLT